MICRRDVGSTLRGGSGEEQFRFGEAHFGQTELRAHVQAAETVFHAAAEIDGRRSENSSRAAINEREAALLAGGGVKNVTG